ncbi:unnamed protein product, partial [marine sediment metagenome]
VRFITFKILQSCNTSKYNLLNEKYETSSISHKKVKEAAQEIKPILDADLQMIWSQGIRKKLIENNIPKNNFLNENARANEIRIWLNNFKNRKPINSITITDLSSYYLETLPPEIGKLIALQELNLDRNKLTTLPESIGKLIVLLELNLFGNNLTTLPESIGKLIALQGLNLGRNNLTTLPESIGKLIALQELNLDRNKLTTLPESIGKLIVLLELNLDRNKLTTLPESIGKLIALQELNLDRNKL